MGEGGAFAHTHKTPAVVVRRVANNKDSRLVAYLFQSQPEEFHQRAVEGRRLSVTTAHALDYIVRAYVFVKSNGRGHFRIQVLIS